MRKILSILAAAVIIAASLTGCDNKPPYVRLAAAIDSLNSQYGQAHNTSEEYITYEKWENVVHFNVDFPAVIDREAFEPVAANIKERFLDQLVADDEFGIATEIIDAKSNIVIDIHGLNDTSYEVLIVTNEVIEAYDRIHAEAEADVEPVDTLTPAEVEQELLEGNAPSIENEE